MEQRKQCGFALPVTVFALVVVGVITTGGFFMAHQEGRIGVASEHAGLAFYLTERGLVDAMGKWNSALYGALLRRFAHREPAAMATSLAQSRVHATCA